MPAGLSVQSGKGSPTMLYVAAISYSLKVGIGHASAELVVVEVIVVPSMLQPVVVTHVVV